MLVDKEDRHTLALEGRHAVAEWVIKSSQATPYQISTQWIEARPGLCRLSSLPCQS